VPSINSDDMQVQLMAIFSVEAEEHLRAMNQHLLTLEDGSASGAREQLMAELFREAHSLKGAARAVGLVEVEVLSHELEDLFERMQQGEVEPDAGVLERAYRTLDLVGMALGNDDGTATAVVAAAKTLLANDEDGPAESLVSRRPTSGGSVRIATGKLDALMTEVGELLVAGIGAERRVGDVRAIESALDDWDSTWRRLGRPTRGPIEADAVFDLMEKTGACVQAARRDLASLRRLLQADARRTNRIMANLQADVRRTRMLPVSTVLELFPRMIRDIARAVGKDVALSVSGGDTEVDRSVLEQIKGSRRPRSV
jgi:two-component system chemotaxis sensor kinase CheA